MTEGFRLEGASRLFSKAPLKAGPAIKSDQFIQSGLENLQPLRSACSSHIWPWHLSLLNFIRFLSAHSSAYLGPYEQWSHTEVLHPFCVIYKPDEYALQHLQIPDKDVEQDMPHCNPMH